MELSDVVRVPENFSGPVCLNFKSQFHNLILQYVVSISYGTAPGPNIRRQVLNDMLSGIPNNIRVPYHEPINQENRPQISNGVRLASLFNGRKSMAI